MYHIGHANFFAQKSHAVCPRQQQQYFSELAFNRIPLQFRQRRWRILQATAFTIKEHSSQLHSTSLLVHCRLECGQPASLHRNSTAFLSSLGHFSKQGQINFRSKMRAQKAFAGAARDFGVSNADEVQALVDEVRYGKEHA